MKLNDIKKDRFIRIATNRTNKIIKSIEVLGNCSNKSAYEYTEDDIKKIFNEIDKTIKKTKSKFIFSNEREFKL